MPGGDAFRAGYDVLFTLCEEFLSSECSVLVDMSMGREFQWHRLDQMCRRQADVVFLPLALRCS